MQRTTKQQTNWDKWKAAFDASGFNPNIKDNFGAGYMCGILFVLDIPFMVFSIIWNFFFQKAFPIKSFGMVALMDVIRGKFTVGKLIGFLIMAVGLRGWFRHDIVAGSASFQSLYIWGAVILAVLGIAGAIYSYGNRLVKQ